MNAPLYKPGQAVYFRVNELDTIYTMGSTVLNSMTYQGHTTYLVTGRRERIHEDNLAALFEGAQMTACIP